MFVIPESTERSQEHQLLEPPKHHHNMKNALKATTSIAAETSSQRNISSLSRPSETPSNRERRLEGLRQYATIARATKTSLEHESRLQSHRNRTETSRATGTLSEREIRFESLRKPTTARATELHHWNMKVGYKPSEIVPQHHELMKQKANMNH